MCIFLDKCLDNNLIDMLGTCNIVKFTFIGVFCSKSRRLYEGWNFNSGNYLFTTDTK